LLDKNNVEKAKNNRRKCNGPQMDAFTSVWQRNRVAAAVYHETTIWKYTQNISNAVVDKTDSGLFNMLEVILTKLIDNEKLATVTNWNAT
jgi:hypothetical protein